MKAVLEFNLPEEEEDFRTAQSAVAYKIVIRHLDDFLRSKVKYEELSKIESKIYSEIRTKLSELCEEELSPPHPLL